MGGAVTARPVHPECPDASSGCIEGPHSPVFGVGPTPVLATELRCALWTITVHACYSTRVITTPRRPNYPLFTIHYGTPLSHFVPPCSTPDTTRGTLGVPFFGKVFHRPDRNGTLWNTMEQLTRKSTAQRPNYPLSHYSYRPLHSAPGRSRTSRRGITAGRRRCPPSRTARCRPSRRPGRRTWTPRLGHEARRPSAAVARR